MPKLNIAFCLFLIIVDIVCKLYPEMNATKKVKLFILFFNKKIKKKLIESGRLFREEWTKLFGAIERNGKALCTLCGDSVVCRTSSVKRHFETNHKNIAEIKETEKQEYLANELKKYHSQRNNFMNFISKPNHLMYASFQFSLCIAKHSKSLSDGDFIKSAILAGSDSLFHDFSNRHEILQRISDLPLNRNTVKDRVLRMAQDVSLQLTTDLQKPSCYSMCLDESTDINNYARLAIILRYAAGDAMREELLKLVSLPERTQGVDIYNAVMECLTTQSVIPAEIFSITTDGALSMVGPTSGFVKLFANEIKRQVVRFHCIIHQEALCAKDSTRKLEDVLKDVTKIVNYIIARALNFRQFQALLGEVKAKYDTLLMYNNVRWLSRGRVLERFVACLNEIRLFMYEKKQDFPQLTDVVWLNSLMFFTDLTMHFNALNTKLQGHGKTAERMFCDIKAFERRLEVFEEDIKSGKLKYFSNLKTHLEDSSSTVFLDGSSSKQKYL